MAAGSFYKGKPSAYEWPDELATYIMFVICQTLRLRELDPQAASGLLARYCKIDPLAAGSPDVADLIRLATQADVNPKAARRFEVVNDNGKLRMVGEGMDLIQQKTALPISIDMMMGHLLHRQSDNMSARRMVLSATKLVGERWADPGAIRVDNANQVGTEILDATMRIEARASAMLDSFLNPDHG